MSERKTDDKQDGPQGKEIFIGTSKKPSSDLETKILEDITKDQSINIEVIMELTIKQLEDDKALQTRYPEEIKMLRQHWKEFSALFQRLSKNT